MSASGAVALLLLPPVVGAVLCALLRIRSQRLATFLGVLALAVSLSGSLLLPSRDRKTAQTLRSEWIRTEAFEIPLTLRLDEQSVPMARRVCLISLAVAIFSQGYLDPKDGRGRCYAYINLLAAMMLLLVLAGNLGILLLMLGAAATVLLASCAGRSPRGVQDPGRTVLVGRVLQRYVACPTRRFATLVWACVDRLLIDTGISFAGALVARSGRGLGDIGEGRLGAYAAWTLVTAAWAAALWTFLAKAAG
ncbi:MAG: hypothetical protein HY608_02700 [Planctomycetes bacterium]|nr:hypothetical protein [Planctomycetota bacterium]